MLLLYQAANQWNPAGGVPPAEDGPTRTYLTPRDPYTVLTVSGPDTILSLDDVHTVLTPDEG